LKLVVTLQREKCIGCNYCEELCPTLFKMSKKDGKSVLLNSVNRKGFHTAHALDDFRDSAEQAAVACPVQIIKINSKA